MSVRALQCRIRCNAALLEHLWRTHVVFNERIPSILSILFRMRRGECGESADDKLLYREIANFVLARDSRDSVYLMNSVSIQGWKPNTARKMRVKTVDDDGVQQEMSGESWAERAEAASASGRLLYNKQELLGDLPDSIRQQVLRESAAILRGHLELVAVWKNEHAEWLKKTAWEEVEEHRRYLAIRHQFEEFEHSVAGKIGKRRGRWHLYLNWMKQHPELAAWRGGVQTVNELSDEANARIARATPRQQRSAEAREFWEANPELFALDKLHGYYEREFVRRRKTKKNQDGFDHRPTFTLPHPVRHPRWFVFNAPQTDPKGYRNLGLPTRPGERGKVELLLLSGESGGQRSPASWTTLEFDADPRLARFVPVQEPTVVRKGKSKGEAKTKAAYRYFDAHLKLELPAQISGAKLLFRNIKLKPDGTLLSATPYLVFACTLEDVPLTEAARSVKWVDGERGRKRPQIPDGLISCAVDLGIRNIGFATAARKTTKGLEVLRSRNIWIGHEEEVGAHPGRWERGPELSHLAAHKRELRYLRRLRGKPVLGEASHAELQDHISHLAEDRFKKAARAIVNFALNADGRIDSRTGLVYPRADILILENLAGLLPDSERERGINSGLIEFNRGRLVERLKDVAVSCGLRVYEVSPYGTSQVCSKCGALGRRYSLRRDRESGQPDIVFGPVEKLFGCVECGYRANSDHNASVNLHRRLFEGERAVERYRERQQAGKQERASIISAVESRLLPQLRRMHGIEVDELPF